jgi:menaquinone-dependent protoporphyrinogen oxidase
MKPILIVYGTTEGHTRKIAEFLAEQLKRRGRDVDLIDSATPAAAQVQPIYAAAIVAGSVHQGKYQSTLAHFVKQNRGWLKTLPCAFVSASLSAVMADEHARRELERIALEFYADTGWTPGVTQHVAGALLYTKYDYFKRLLMRLIAKQRGGETDASRDYEYTDWNTLSAFVDDFLKATGGSMRA